MIYNILFAALGAMTLAFIIAEISRSLANKLYQSKKCKLFCNLLIFIYHFASIASLFVGFCFHLKKKQTDNIIKTVDELSATNASLAEKIDILQAEKTNLQKQLQNEAHRTNERIHNHGYHNGYINGYAVGFEDCMDVINLPQNQQQDLMKMARTSGIHRIKTRRTMLDCQKADNQNGTLK